MGEGRGKAVLSWQTASEKDNEKFEVQVNAPVALRLHPNPTSTTVTVSHGLASGQLRVMDVTGQVVLHRAIAQHAVETTLDLAGLPQGIYQVVLEGPNGRTASRVVKQ
jgi:hypothetical protein